MKKTTLVIAATFLLVGCINSSVNNHGQEKNDAWENVCYLSFKRHVVAISGTYAKDCGFFTLESDATTKDAVRACATKAIQSAEPFRFGHRSAGDDSWFCDVAVRDQSGKLWSFFYDSDVTGGSGGPATIWVSECEAIAMEPGTIGADSFFHLTGCQERRDIKMKLLGK